MRHLCDISRWHSLLCDISASATRMRRRRQGSPSWDGAGSGCVATWVSLFGEANFAERSGRFQGIRLALVYLPALATAVHTLHHRPPRPRLQFAASTLPVTSPTHISTDHGQGNVSSPLAPVSIAAIYKRASHRKYYDLLEVSPEASESDLKKAYRKK